MRPLLLSCPPTTTIDRMTKTKSARNCPMCRKRLLHVSKHIREFHIVANEKERDILNKYAADRIVVPPGPCPMPNCLSYIANVEKHMKAHRDLSGKAIAKKVRRLKQSVAVDLLRELRATDPTPPMVSTLDLEAPTSSSTHSSRNPACMQRVHYLTTEVCHLQQALTEAKRLAQPRSGPQEASKQVQKKENIIAIAPLRRCFKKPSPSADSSSHDEQPRSEPQEEEMQMWLHLSPSPSPSSDLEEPVEQPQQAVKRMLSFSVSPSTTEPTSSQPHKRKMKTKHVTSPPESPGEASDKSGALSIGFPHVSS
nr:uncharacterized protein LOC129154591 [Nothobranchius furzeri]